jgi:preprotein translocase subunit SecE
VSDSTTAGGEGKPTPKRGADDAQRKGMFARLALFLRQVVAELRKVIWPTRRELLTYTWVVLVFVVIMAGLIGLLDLALARVVFAVFGGE